MPPHYMGLHHASEVGGRAASMRVGAVRGCFRLPEVVMDWCTKGAVCV